MTKAYEFIIYADTSQKSKNKYLPTKWDNKYVSSSLEREKGETRHLGVEQWF